MKKLLIALLLCNTFFNTYSASKRGRSPSPAACPGERYKFSNTSSKDACQVTPTISDLTVDLTLNVLRQNIDSKNSARIDHSIAALYFATAIQPEFRHLDRRLLFLLGEDQKMSDIRRHCHEAGDHRTYAKINLVQSTFMASLHKESKINPSAARAYDSLRPKPLGAGAPRDAW